MIPPVANRFVAGETAGEALDHARALNSRGVGAILNRVGEHYDRPDPATADTRAYCQLIEDIDADSLRASISVKPSQIGLGVDERLFRENLARIGSRARAHDVGLWLDMEDHTTTEATIAAFEETAHSHMGLCLQANLKRTRDDLARLADRQGRIRLVKGAYDEPADIAFQDRERVNEAYLELLEYAFREFDEGIAVASHDPVMIERALELHETYGTGFEIQMLMGVRETAQFDLAADYDVHQYVPYGPQWVSYFLRRVAERKENLIFAIRAVLGQPNVGRG